MGNINGYYMYITTLIIFDIQVLYSLLQNHIYINELFRHYGIPIMSKCSNHDGSLEENISQDTIDADNYGRKAFMQA